MMKADFCNNFGGDLDIRQRAIHRIFATHSDPRRLKRNGINAAVNFSLGGNLG